jgi:hypothetical protein
VVPRDRLVDPTPPWNGRGMKEWLAIAVVTGCAPDPKAPAGSTPQMCSGQTPESAATATTPRAGEMPLQLAPSLLDHMAPCAKRDASPPPDLVLASAGSVTEQGDCEWSNGVSCHFHLGAEFVDSRAPRPNVGELHCIFPSGEPKSPRVYGTHFTCTRGTAVSHEHDVHPGQPCGANLLRRLSAMMDRCDARCCDDGTLTSSTEARREEGTLDVRADFRICTTTAELDCSMLSTMTGHPANAPRFGAPVDLAM